jgi:hypothetical protein
VHRKEVGVKWDETNKYFRSSVWDRETGNLISAGFRAFVNLGEQPDFEPWTDSLNASAILKIDGSCLIVSIYKGELIARTRGTIDARTLSNGHEIELLKQKYPKAFDNHILRSENFTLLYEWTTPTNVIVLKEHDTPTLSLIGAVYHGDYSYVSQDRLDKLATTIGVERPRKFDTNNSQDLIKLLEHNKEIEGVVLYSEDGQILKKIKTPHYLSLHKLLAGFKSFRNVVETWVQYGRPSIADFEAQIASFFDWEVLESIKPHMDTLLRKTLLVENKISEINRWARTIAYLEGRERAEVVKREQNEWAFVAFNILNNKNLPPIEKMFDLVD